MVVCAKPLLHDLGAVKSGVGLGQRLQLRLRNRRGVTSLGISGCALQLLLAELVLHAYLPW